jgi:hypothetical protein
MLHEFDESSGEFHHVDWREVVARLAANGTTNAGNGFDQCHIYQLLVVQLFSCSVVTGR